MMDWKDVAHVVAPLAPVLGGVLGGFIPIPGGALAGQAVGSLIARAFGVEPTPDAVHGAIAANPNEVVLAKLAQATEMARIEVNGFVEAEKAYLQTIQISLAQTGATMRAEIGHEHWYFNGWRPASGWLFVFFAGVYGLELAVALALAAFFGKPAALTVIVDAWPAFLALLGPLALMVGVYVIGRSSEKGRAIEAGASVPTSIGGKVQPVADPPRKAQPPRPALPVDRHAPA